MEEDRSAERCFFYESKSQPDICAFACFNATIRDYARVGLMMMRGGDLGSQRILPKSWVQESTTPRAAFLKPGALGEMGGPMGYAYQWWLEPGEDGAFEAIGIYGQSILSAINLRSSAYTRIGKWRCEADVCSAASWKETSGPPEGQMAFIANPKLFQLDGIFIKNWGFGVIALQHRGYWEVQGIGDNCNHFVYRDSNLN